MSNSLRKPPAHPGAALSAIGGMSIVVAAVLHLLGISHGLDGAISRWVDGAGLGDGFRELPAWAMWVWTVLASFGLAAAMLVSQHSWRRTVLWVTVLVLTLAWVPVLALASWHAPVAVPLMAVLWCGLWSMIYAARHQEPGDA